MYTSQNIIKPLPLFYTNLLYFLHMNLYQYFLKRSQLLVRIIYLLFALKKLNILFNKQFFQQDNLFE